MAPSWPLAFNLSADSDAAARGSLHLACVDSAQSNDFACGRVWNHELEDLGEHGGTMHHYAISDSRLSSSDAADIRATVGKTTAIEGRIAVLTPRRMSCVHCTRRILADARPSSKSRQYSARVDIVRTLALARCEMMTLLRMSRPYLQHLHDDGLHTKDEALLSSSPTAFAFPDPSTEEKTFLCCGRDDQHAVLCTYHFAVGTIPVCKERHAAITNHAAPGKKTSA